MLENVLYVTNFGANHQIQPVAVGNYRVTDNGGAPSIDLRFQGTFFRGAKQRFCFATAAIGACRLPDELANGLAGGMAFDSVAGKAMPGVIGVVMGLTGGFLAKAAARMRKSYGLCVMFENGQGQVQMFTALANNGEIVDRILNSVPPERQQLEICQDESPSGARYFVIKDKGSS